jgi:transposase
VTRLARAPSRPASAVTTGLTLPCSSVGVEGIVTKIKLGTRQMYGRAGFALLQARHPSPRVARDRGIRAGAQNMF